MRIFGHTCFIGNTGYANHARSFFTSLNKYHEVKIRNLTIGSGWSGFNNTPHDNESYITDEMKEMLYQQTLYNSTGDRIDHKIYSHNEDFVPDVHIILLDTNGCYFYDHYDGYKIAYNVWESTRYPESFFRRLFYFDEVWVPSEWQKECLIEQGYPAEKICVVPEGVDINVFKPLSKIPTQDKFRFLLFGRWEYRKSTIEIINTFVETFKGLEDEVELVCSIENSFATDGFKNSTERLKYYNITNKNIKLLNFPSREDYVKYLQEGHVFISCSRSEGWNLPLCIPEGKLVFCNDDFVPIENVKINDNIITHNGHSQKVLKTFKREYNDEIIRINLYGDHELLELTPEHPVYGIKRKSFFTKKDRHKNIPKITPEWIKSKDIEKGDIIIRTLIPQKYFKNENFDMTELDTTLKYDNEKVWYKMGYTQSGELRKYNRYINLWELSFLFGWYIAEGCNGESKLLFVLNAKKETNVAEKLISEMNRIFGSYGHYVIKNNTIIVTFCSKLLCKFFTYFCGKMSYNKKIPPFILSGPLPILEELVKNMILGDGCFLEKHNNFHYTTVSRILSRQLMFANQRLGIKCSLHKNTRVNRTNRICYDFIWSKNNENGRHSNKSWKHPQGLAILVRKVDITNYKGLVYNLEVENDNSYLLSNATVHNCESMSCGTPSIYSECSGQLEFAKNKGIPVKVLGTCPANADHMDFPGEYYEPDFNDLSVKMMDAFIKYGDYHQKAVEESKIIHEKFNWDNIAQIASKTLEKKKTDFVFVTTGNIDYMPLIDKLVKSINEFSNMKIIVYGVNCEVPFDYPCLIKRKLTPPFHSEHDRWYWKQYACIESLKEDYENFVWIDGDAIVNYNIDKIEKYFNTIENYPISDIHIQNEYFAFYDGNNGHLFGEELSKEFNVKRQRPFTHICMYVYNKKCEWWFNEIIGLDKSIPLSEYKRMFLWNDEEIDNFLRWKNNFREYLPISNFDTSGYDGEFGSNNNSLNHFYKFWNEDGPQNFNRIYGFQFIPKDKSNILYFHGNKDIDIAENMIQFIKIRKDESLYKSEYFYTDVYKFENLGDIKEVEGGTLDIAQKYGWARGIYHEIYNLKDYYLNREKRIFDGDIVVDLGGNIGVFTRWAYSQGASKVITFEPDKRYFKLLSLNSDPRTILFNAAVSDKMGEMELYESDHLGGSTLLEFNGYLNKYKVRTYTLDYLFETRLINKIDFLKIDIEGSEVNVLNGISDENLRKIRDISLEYHHSHLQFNVELRDKFIERLNRNGFNTFLLLLGDDDSLQMIYATNNNNKTMDETNFKLDDYAKKHNTDKSSNYHNYCVKYEKYLPFKRDDKLKILEIGVADGGSLKTWKDYFYNSDIIGIDILPGCKKIEEERIKVEIGSQIDSNFLKSIIDKYGPFDMILDDGSHINSDVIFSFKELFPSLKSQGVYIIEDSVTSYWNDYGGGMLNPKSTIEYFKKLVDDVNYRGIYNKFMEMGSRDDDSLTMTIKKDQTDCVTDIEYICFLNSITIIRKK